MAGFGGTAPLLATWLLGRFDNAWLPIATRGISPDEPAGA